jgi:hypothetical protein
MVKSSLFLMEMECLFILENLSINVYITSRQITFMLPATISVTTLGKMNKVVFYDFLSFMYDWEGL